MIYAPPSLTEEIRGESINTSVAGASGTDGTCGSDIVCVCILRMGFYTNARMPDTVVSSTMKRVSIEK